VGFGCQAGGGRVSSVLPTHSLAGLRLVIRSALGLPPRFWRSHWTWSDHLKAGRADASRGLFRSFISFKESIAGIIEISPSVDADLWGCDSLKWGCDSELWGRNSHSWGCSSNKEEGRDLLLHRTFFGADCRVSRGAFPCVCGAAPSEQCFL